MDGPTALSPELVLVSPDLREEALALLPDPIAPGAHGAATEPAAAVANRRSVFSSVEVTVRVPLLVLAAAYLTTELALRVAGGVGVVVLVVAAHSLALA